MKQGTNSRLEWIQVLRAVAALYVFLFHFRIALPLWSQEATDQWVQFQMRGYLGVDLFFVISGFIMAWTCVLSGRSTDRPLAFGVKRAFRIAPPYWIATFVALYLLGANKESGDIIRSLLFLPLANSGAPFYGYAAHFLGWTLNYEVCFYIIFAAALMLPKRYSLWAAVAVIGLLVFGIPLWLDASRLPYPDRMLDVSRRYVQMATNPMMLEFALGIAAASLYSWLRGKAPRTVAVSIFAVGVALFAWRMGFHDGAHGGHDPIKVGIPAAILVLGAALMDDAQMLRAPAFLVRLGEISFAIYLTHTIALDVITTRFAPPANGPGAQYGRLIVITSGVIVVAHCWYRWVEQPSMRLGMRIAAFFTRGQRAPAVASSSIAAGTGPLQ